MTTICVEWDGGWVTLRAVGHATGSVEVCAAVSALLFSLAGYLKTLEASGEVEVGTLRLNSGDAEVRFRSRGAVRAMAAFESVMVGLSMLEEQYGDFMHIKKNFTEKTKGGRQHGSQDRDQSETL